MSRQIRELAGRSDEVNEEKQGSLAEQLTLIPSKRNLVQNTEERNRSMYQKLLKICGVILLALLLVGGALGVIVPGAAQARIGLTGERGETSLKLKPAALAAGEGEHRDRGAAGIPHLAPDADLGLTLSGSGGAPVGETITYTLVVTNSVITASNTVVTHTLPASISYDTASISPTRQINQVLAWELGTIGSLGSESLVITGSVHPSATIGAALVATATVTSNLSETILTNNTASVTDTVEPGPAASLVITAPNEVDLLVPFTVTTRLKDQYGNMATTYTGTVTLTGTGLSSGLPASHQFIPADEGIYTFTNLALKTVGGQTITATDGILSDTGLITVDDEVVIERNGIVWDETEVVLTSLVVTNSATLELNGVTVITADNIIVNSGASISADGLGHPYETGEGKGREYTVYIHCSGSGAGYGGYGGYGVSFSSHGSCIYEGHHYGRGGVPYGSLYHPVDKGSGGGGGSGYGYASQGGSGGGAIHLIVSDTLAVSGTISANGQSVRTASHAGGGGSGGSIWIEAGLLSGAGTIAANGGKSTTTDNWNQDGGVGGGGRIAI